MPGLRKGRCQRSARAARQQERRMAFLTVQEGDRRMTEQVTIKAWGNSFGIRIPKKMMEKLNIRSDDVLIMEATEDALIMRKAFRHRSFEERLAEYGGKISVEEFDWGEPKGRELL